ncbi:MAG TPA: exonuclease domain-containing protein [Methylomirabilota bacterium]|nr:exonuclease domain-containing protein [Methylomirabilota bacterium]
MPRGRFERKLVIGILALFVPPAAFAVGAVLFLRARGTLADPSVLAAVLLVGSLALLAYLAVTAAALGRVVIRSLRAVRQGAELIGTVNPDHRLQAHTGDEIEGLAEDINRLADRWAAARRALAEQEARANRALTAEHARLAAVLEHLDEGVLVVTGQGTIALANRAAGGLLGAGRPLLGRNVLELVPGEPLAGYLARVRAGQPVRVRTSLRGPDGPVEARISSLAPSARGADGLILALRGSEAAGSGGPAIRGMGLVSGVSVAEPGPERSLLYDFSHFEAVTKGLDAATRGQRLAETTFAVLDTETTGLSPRTGDRVVSIAVVLLDRGRVRAQEAFDALVNPQRPIPVSSQRFHGITDAMVAGAPRIAEVLSALARYVADAPVAGHEIAFDLEFLDAEARRTGLPSLADGRPILDTRLISHAIHGPGVSHSLEAVAERLGVTIQARHSALGDALATAEILARLLELASRRGIETLGDLLDAIRSRRPLG